MNFFNFFVIVDRFVAHISAIADINDKNKATKTSKLLLKDIRKVENNIHEDYRSVAKLFLTVIDRTFPHAFYNYITIRHH